jgi:hypothetical protein
VSDKHLYSIFISLVSKPTDTSCYYCFYLILSENVYVTVSTGVLTIYHFVKDGKSEKHQMGLYGAAVGLIAPDLVSGQKHCFRVVNGIESLTLQTSSYDDMMDWSTAIVHGISMENGGGLLLNKAKKESPSTMNQDLETSIVRGVGDNDGDVKTSIVFSKQLHETDADKPPVITRSKSLDSFNQPAFGNRNTLNVSRSTDATEMNTTFKTLDPADLSETMQNFANNFFINTHNELPEINKDVLPLQALRVQDASDSDESIGSTGSEYFNLDVPWLEIDKASSATGSVAMSDEDVVEKYLDLDASTTHLNTQDFATLLRYNECFAGGRVEKVEDLEAGTFRLV